MTNKSWIQIQRDNVKVDYAPVSRSRHYPEQSTKQLSKRNSSNLQPENNSIQEGHSPNQHPLESESSTDDS